MSRLGSNNLITVIDILQKIAETIRILWAENEVNFRNLSKKLLSLLLGNTTGDDNCDVLAIALSLADRPQMRREFVN